MFPRTRWLSARITHCPADGTANPFPGSNAIDGRRSHFNGLFSRTARNITVCNFYKLFSGTRYNDICKAHIDNQMTVRRRTSPGKYAVMPEAGKRVKGKGKRRETSAAASGRTARNNQPKPNISPERKENRHVQPKRSKNYQGVILWLPSHSDPGRDAVPPGSGADRKSTRLNSSHI